MVGESVEFMEAIKSIASVIYLPKIGIKDIVEIGIIIVFLYSLIKGMVNTRAMVIVKGLICIVGIYLVAYMFEFNAILMIFKELITVCLFASVMIFQPELRKIIERLGTEQVKKTKVIKDMLSSNIDYNDNVWYSDKSINEIAKACKYMSDRKTGALIVIGRNIPLDQYESTGTKINGEISEGLLVNIFEKNTPLHDGAVIINGNLVTSAACYLKLTQSTNVDKLLGTRHRAGIGVTEDTDCITVIVSEETGGISYIKAGEITRGVTVEKLKDLLKADQDKGEKIKISKLSELKHIIKHNWRYKLTSLIVGVLGWLVLMNVYNPIVTYTFSNIPIEIVNESIIEGNNQILSLDKDKVDVYVTSNRRVLDGLKTTDIQVIADVENINLANQIGLTVTATGVSNDNIRIKGNGFVKCYIDDIVEKEFTLEKDINVSDKLSDNFEVQKVTCSTDTITVRGGSKVIEKIGSVKVSYTVDHVEDVINTSVGVVVYDKNGDVVDMGITLSQDTVDLQIESGLTKEVPINIDIKEVNGGDYSTWKISRSINEVKLAGVGIDNVNSITIPLNIDFSKIDMTDNNYKISFDINDYIPNDVSIISEHMVDVVIEFAKYEEETVTYGTQEIELRNLGNGLEGSIGDGSIRVKFKCKMDYGNGESKKVGLPDLHPYVDLAGKGVGEYTLGILYDNADIKVTDGGSVKVVVKSSSNTNSSSGQVDSGTSYILGNDNQNNSTSGVNDKQNEIILEGTPSYGSDSKDGHEDKTSETMGVEDSANTKVEDSENGKDNQSNKESKENKGLQDKPTSKPESVTPVGWKR